MQLIPQNVAVRFVLTYLRDGVPGSFVELLPASDLHSKEHPVRKATRVKIEQRAMIDHRRMSTCFDPMPQQLLTCAWDRSVVAFARNLRPITPWTMFEKFSVLPRLGYFDEQRSAGP